MRIEVVNKPVSDRERAEMRGELTKENIDEKIAEIGYSKLADYEREFISTDILSDPSEEDVLNYCKEVKVRYFNDLCEIKIVEGFEAFNGHFYRTNRDDQTNMIGQKDLLSENPSIELVYWKTEDVGYTAHSREEWLQVYQEAFAHKQGNLFKYDAIKRKCIEAKTHEELENIVW